MTLTIKEKHSISLGEYIYTNESGSIQHRVTSDGSRCCGMASIAGMNQLEEEELIQILEEMFTVEHDGECLIYGDFSKIDAHEDGQYLAYVTLTDFQMNIRNRHNDELNHVVLSRVGFKHRARWRNPNSGNYVNLLTHSAETGNEPPFEYGVDPQKDKKK